VVFYELLGLSRPRAIEAFERGFEWLNAHHETDTCRPAWSPHAPYSVHTWLFEQATGLTNAWMRPCATHLAESADELQLLRHRAGPFVDFLTGLGAWDDEGLARSPQEIIERCLGAGPLLLIHCNCLSPDTELHSETSVVYCPRTHAAFGHPPHPFRDFLARGVRVALGTDSLASNPDLDLLAEARCIAARYHDFSLATLLRMATLSGAEALGWADALGSLTPGKSADLIVLPLPDRESADPHDLIFQSDAAISRVMFRGHWRER
jgi:cytosine/adenosine deaminase-related metal-dependent hydrolase